MYKSIFSVFIILFGFTACFNNSSENGSNESSEQEILPKSNGSHAELLILVDDNLFQNGVGEVILEAFADEQYGLPQPEPWFKLIQVEQREANHLLKRNKSIFIAEISEQSELIVKYDVWSRPQILIQATAPSVEELNELIRENSEDVFNKIRAHDEKIMKATLSRNKVRKIPESLKEIGIESIVLPKAFENTVETGQLRVFKNKALRSDQYLVFYTRKMPEGTITGEDIIAARDSIGKNYFEGDNDRSYLATEMRLPPVQSTLEIDGMFAIETRGLWKTVGDFMGGPFVNYTIYDEANEQIITIEGMIYAPNERKRNVLFELETIIKSVKLSSN